MTFGAVRTEDPLDAESDLESGGRAGSWARLRADRGFQVGVVVLGTLVAASVLAPWIAPHDPNHEYRELMPLDGSALPPSAMFPLGTDVLGRDYLSRLLYAGRATLAVGFAANLVAVAIGTLVGLVAAYARVVRVRAGGRSVAIPVETMLMRLTDIGLAFPVLLLAIAATSVLGPSLLLVTLVIAGVLWTTTARIVYARAVQIRSAEFVTASRALGVSGPRILRATFLPHVLPLIVVLFSLGIASTILFEATLSFLGAGAPTNSPTWGRLLSDHLAYYRTDLRLPLLPGIAIVLTVFAGNLIADACRDVLDPRSARAR